MTVDKTHWSPTDRLLFACSRQVFTDAHQQLVRQLCSENDIVWDDIFQTAEQHGLAPLIYINLRSCLPAELGVRKKVIEQFERTLIENLLRKKAFAEKVFDGLVFFRQRSIDTMIIKGGALDLLVYDQPYYTALLDIDLIIRAKREEVTTEEAKEFMSFFHQTGVEYDYFEHHDVTMNGMLPVDFDAVWRDADTLIVGDQEVFIMSPEDLLISLCINSCRKRFYRLKSLCDIAETVNKFPNLNWSKFLHKAHSYECQNIVYAALFITRITVGCSLPDNLLSRLKVPATRRFCIQLLCRHMSTKSFSSLYDGKEILNRSLDPSLVLSYLTYRWHHIWQKMKHVIMFERGEKRRSFRFWQERDSYPSSRQNQRNQSGGRLSL